MDKTWFNVHIKAKSIWALHLTMSISLYSEEQKLFVSWLSTIAPVRVPEE